MRLTNLIYTSLCVMIFGLFALPSVGYAGGIPLGQSAINADLGFALGGADLGADYEYGYSMNYSVGAYLRDIPDSTGSTMASGLTTFGAFIRPHFSKANWDFYVSPGFGLVSYKRVNSSANTNNYTLFGPSFAVGLLYELTPNMSVGAEDMSIYGWWNSNVSGLLNEDLTAKFRYIF